MQLIRALSVLLLLAGCSINREPYMTYDNSNYPLKYTAVLSAAELNQDNWLFGFTKLDGREVSSFSSGRPLWVRVLPGPHNFEMKACRSSLVALIIVTTCFDSQVSVPFMKPGHVYVLESGSGQGAYDARDLGLYPDYGITLGLEGVNKERHRVKFE